MSASEHSRRNFLKLLSASAAGAAVVGFNPLTRSWMNGEAAAASPAGFRDVPELDGVVHFDAATLARYANDYGQVVHELPVAVLEPGSTRDIRRMIRFARRNRIRVAARGQGHLPFGQAQVSGGLVIDMRSLSAVHTVGDGWVEVDAGITWLELLTATLARGQTPPVLTSTLHVTVGGTLSVGGISPASDRYGAQVDNVVELEVMAADGIIRRCSPDRRPELFDAALAGQGQCGIITRARLALVPAPTTVREFFMIYPDRAALLADTDELAADRRFDGVTGLLFPAGDQVVHALFCTKGFSDAAPDNATLLGGLDFVPGTEQSGDLPYFDSANAVPPLAFTAARPDLALFVPATEAAGFLDTVVPRLTPNDLGEFATIQLFFWPEIPVTRPLLRVPSEGGVMLFGLIRTPTTDDATRQRYLEGNRVMFDLNRERGGTHYPFTALALARAEWERHYGRAFGGLADAKRRYDPRNVFASGPDIF